jgi:hypothetical protein
MGHADPRTTRRYDRSRHNLDRHPTYKWPASCGAPPVRTSGVPPMPAPIVVPALPIDWGTRTSVIATVAVLISIEYARRSANKGRRQLIAGRKRGTTRSRRRPRRAWVIFRSENWRA